MTESASSPAASTAARDRSLIIERDLLTPTPSGTHVCMEQSGFHEDQQAAYTGAKYGWQRFIGNLEGLFGGTE